MIISDAIQYIGVDDKTIDLFESQYPVPNGVSYNSYLILDEKTALMDTVDLRGLSEWSENLKKALGGRKLDYIVVQHMEPDHSGSLYEALKQYPDATVVGNAKTFLYMDQFGDVNVEGRKLVVKEGDTLSLGSHTLQFIMAPMVHWPEVMVTYESTEKILFTADGFGKFGSLDTEEDWACEARRYYFNIVGKYGMPVQTLLKKAAGLEIEKILPLHGPALTENLGYYLDLYNTWSSYAPEKSGVVLFTASIHGNTMKAAKKLEELIREAGEEQVKVVDLCRSDVAECVEDAFKYDRAVLLAASYDGGAFLPMEDFLHHLSRKTWQNRTVAVVENGTWAPSAKKAMTDILATMKNITVLEESVTLKSSMKEADLPAMKALAEAIVAAGR